MSELQDTYLNTIQWIAVQSPTYLVWIAGILWAMITWNRHRRKSFLVVLVLTFFLFEDLAWPFIMQFLLNRAADDSGLNFMADWQKSWMIMQFCQSLLTGGLWVLLFLAIFWADSEPADARGPDGELLPPDTGPERPRHLG